MNSDQTKEVDKDADRGSIAYVSTQGVQKTNVFFNFNVCDHSLASTGLSFRKWPANRRSDCTVRNLILWSIAFSNVCRTKPHSLAFTLDAFCSIARPHNNDLSLNNSALNLILKINYANIAWTTYYTERIRQGPVTDIRDRCLVTLVIKYLWPKLSQPWLTTRNYDFQPRVFEKPWLRVTCCCLFFISASNFFFRTEENSIFNTNQSIKTEVHF